MTYTEMPNGYIRRERDGVMFPKRAENIEYQEFLHWLDEGNTPQPYVPPAVDPAAQAKAELAESDSDMARIVEDLINVMLTKDLITESDIPQSAQDKMARRAKLRARLA